VLPRQFHKSAVRCNKHIFVGGQTDPDRASATGSGSTLITQAKGAMTSVTRALAAAGADAADLVKLTVFHVIDDQSDEQALLREIAHHIGDSSTPGPAISLVPLPVLRQPATLVEIEAWAMRGLNGERLPRQQAWHPDGPRLPSQFSQAIRCGEMIFTSAVTSIDASDTIRGLGSIAEQSRIVLPKLDGLLRQLGASLADCVKTNVWNVEPGTKENWREPAFIRASHYPEPGPTATGISLPRLARDGLMLANDVIAMRNIDGSAMQRTAVWPDNHWDWTIHLPYRHGLRCGDLVFLGGQVSLDNAAAVLDKGDMAAQTRTSMTYIGRILGELGMSFEPIATHFPASGPASTIAPAPWLAYEDMLTEIDIVAMV
jgi:enamine deaminase RidA (YjgF/YER057c/UK114 family)